MPVKVDRFFGAASACTALNSPLHARTNDQIGHPRCIQLSHTNRPRINFSASGNIARREQAQATSQQQTSQQDENPSTTAVIRSYLSSTSIASTCTSTLTLNSNTGLNITWDAFKRNATTMIHHSLAPPPLTRTNGGKHNENLHRAMSRTVPGTCE